jgi:putative ABC transport system permease protein
MIFWKIAFRNVKKNWRHSLSALLSLSASFVSLVLFDGYIADLKAMYADSYAHAQMLGDLIIEKPLLRQKEGLANPGKYMLFPNEQKQIDDFIVHHQSTIQNRVRFLDFKGMISNGMQSTIILSRGSDIAEGAKMRGSNWSWNATFGVPLFLSKEENPVLLGQGLSRKLGCHYEHPKNFNTHNGGYEPVDRPFECPTKDLQISLMTDDGQLNAVDVTAVGLFDVGYRDVDDRYASVSLTTAQTLLNTPNVSMYTLALQSPGQKSEIAEAFKKEVISQFPDIQIMPWMKHPMGNAYVKSMDLLAVFRNFVIIVILVISTLSVANTLIKIIKERSREIGTLRSIGFKSRQILEIFVIETFLLGSLGAAAGFVASVVLTFLMNGLRIRYKAGMLSEPVLFRISLDVPSYLTAFLILLVVSFIACLLSTRQSLRRKIVDNLNHV